MRFNLVIFIIFICAYNVNAEFSVAEKDEVVTQIKALHNASNAAYWAVQHARSFPSDNVVVSSFIQNLMVFGWEAHAHGILLLLDMAGTSSDRQNDVAAALTAITATGYTSPRSQLEAITNTSQSLTNAKNLLDDAIAERASIDTSLNYVEPRMNINLAIPGATREVSSAIGPHGSYRDLGAALYTWTRNIRREWVALANAFETCGGFMYTSKGGGFAAGHMNNFSRVFIIPAALAANIIPDYRINSGDGPHKTIQENLDIMRAGGTTARQDEFFNIQFALEMYLMFTHVGARPYDINGRHTVRGLSYDFAVSGQVWSNAANDADSVCGSSEDQESFLNHVKLGIQAYSNAWANMDEASYHGMLILKHFQVFPPPGPGGGGGGKTCGEGTHDDGTGVCVPDPCPDCPPAPTCPTFVPRLFINTDTIQAQCVEDLQ